MNTLMAAAELYNNKNKHTANMKHAKLLVPCVRGKSVAKSQGLLTGNQALQNGP